MIESADTSEAKHRKRIVQINFATPVLIGDAAIPLMMNSVLWMYH